MRTLFHSKESCFTRPHPFLISARAIAPLSERLRAAMAARFPLGVVSESDMNRGRAPGRATACMTCTDEVHAVEATNDDEMLHTPPARPGFQDSSVWPPHTPADENARAATSSRRPDRNRHLSDTALQSRREAQRLRMQRWRSTPAGRQRDREVNRDSARALQLFVHIE